MEKMKALEGIKSYGKSRQGERKGMEGNHRKESEWIGTGRVARNGDEGTSNDRKGIG